MAEVIRMPRMSDTMEEGNIVEWHKKVGDKVEPGDVLAEVETDKATMDLESYHDGVLLYIGVEEGPVPVDGILAVIGKEGEDYKAALKEEKAKDVKVKAVEEENGEEEKKEEDKKETPKAAEKAMPVSDSATEEIPVSSPASGEERIKASPLARKMASTAGVLIGEVKGTGDGGRIVKRDIEEYISRQKEAPQTVSPLLRKTDFEFGKKPLSQMRKTIAKRLSASKFSAPHFYLTIEINMDKAVDARNDINEHPDIKISFNDLIIKACATALRIHPEINVSWKEDHLLYHQDIHIGVAVAVDEGLLVPVIKNTDLKSLSMINFEVRDFADRARKKKLQLEEMQGNTFTVSNLGMFGIEEFTAIINPPDACILAVGAIIQKPIVKKEGTIEPAHMMKVTLSCDHRLVDGARGANFLKTLKSLLENPVRILV